MTSWGGEAEPVRVLCHACAGLLRVDQCDLEARIEALTDGQLDAFDFGVIGFDAEGMVCRYNATESRSAGLSPQRVLGRSLFTLAAPGTTRRYVLVRWAG